MRPNPAHRAARPAPLAFEFRAGGIWLPGLDLWLDPHEACRGPERVFVSHAHSDHTARHREVILTAPTARLMQARLGGDPVAHCLPWGEAREFLGRAGSWRITLWPAGHIFGSAMAWVEAGGETLLYTGDFKLRPGWSAEVCQPRAADVLIMETTFGRPHYRFPDAEAVLRGVVRFCREAIDNDEVPVLLGYSLGKSQEIMCGLRHAGLPLVVHEQVYRLARIYEDFGVPFPPYACFQGAVAPGSVLIWPPMSDVAAALGAGTAVRTALLTGWALDAASRHRSSADAVFPLSDHADFAELIEFVERVRPRQVYTLHGFAAEFAAALRDRGYDARALGAPEQLTLALGAAEPPPPPAGPEAAALLPAAASACEGGAERGTFAAFAALIARLRETPDKTAKVHRLAEYLRTRAADELEPVANWVAGEPFGRGTPPGLALGEAALRDVVCAVTGLGAAAYQRIRLLHADASSAVSETLAGQVPGPGLEVADVQALLTRLAAAAARSERCALLTAALKRCEPGEAEALLRLVLRQLRLGLSPEHLLDAVAQAFRCPAEAVRQARNSGRSLGETAGLASGGRLKPL